MTTARTLIPSIADADAAFAAWKANDPVPGIDATRDEYAAWCQRRNTVLDAVKTAEHEHADALCVRCTGTGRKPEYTHRRRGVCYGCGGDGFSRAGRLAARVRP